MARTRERLVTPVRRLVQLLLVAFVVIYFVLPQIAGARRALSLLGGVNLWLIVLGVALEATSILCYANLTRAMIHGTSPPYLTLLRINLSTLAVSHVVPGGAAVGGALGFRLLTRFGLSGTDAAFAIAAQGIGSAVVLNLLLWVGLLVSILGGDYNPLYATAALVGVLLLGGFSAVVVLLMRGERGAAGVMRTVARRVPFLDEESVYQLVLRLAARLQTLVADRRRLVRGLLWDLGFWLFSAASLWVFLLAFGYRAGVDGLIVAFGLAYVLAAIPITPAGLGVVEATMIALLTFFGADRGIATLGVVSYRLINFWLPIPLGALAYLSLQVELETLEGRRRIDERRNATELRRLAERSLREAEDRRTWAERHGVKLGRREPPSEP
ncbi:MAG TPA: lysylphosphatidylglycerol synthase transmembrane domain-containing protein [Actinomycetota bacterium]|nr:lysylphosphatidylglycerol synthase transmembrane domain-containing protein [Actinomycetota bacterium]